MSAVAIFVIVVTSPVIVALAAVGLLGALGPLALAAFGRNVLTSREAARSMTGGIFLIGIACAIAIAVHAVTRWLA